MHLSESQWNIYFCFIVFFTTVVDGRSVSIEISHEEAYAAEEFEEQEVIPEVEVLAGDKLHVIKIGDDLIKDLQIPSDVFSNLTVTSSLGNTTAEHGHAYDQYGVVKEEKIIDESASNPISEVMPRQNRSRLFILMTGRNFTTVAPSSTPRINLMKTFLANRRRRHKRQVGLDMSNIANEGWAYEHTTEALNSSTVAEKDSFQVITELDRDNARKAQLKTIMIFAGSTLLTVLMFSAIMFCFLRDPKSCIVAFGTGCPCLIVIFPCVMKCLDKYLNPARMVKENLNRYLPGVIIHEDGTVEKYDTTPEEIECITEIIDEVMGL
ncbi:uncharacterized protein LOC132546337 [Ylistrum balloti]|uniref:uncharacterized protein LOC132546337 n=1 Tax=Ylistrum balloti TaxID=509963 RepID=UPI002905E75F|nr:uncharacterized protein LOC132546337 [Ylistrum balloti]